jgi:CubicO group peptidase (beta-lactamase class C family)
LNGGEHAALVKNQSLDIGGHHHCNSRRVVGGLPKTGPIGSGFVAKYICSSTFISERDPESVFAEDVKPANPLAAFASYNIDRKEKSVTGNIYGMFDLKAIYREGCGCSLVLGTTEEELRAQKLVPPGFAEQRPQRREDLPWPAGSGTTDVSRVEGIDMAKIETAIAAAFAEPSPENLRKTRAVVVVHDGKLIAERYAPGFHKDMPLLGWSMGKSVTNALVGILVKEGKLDIMQPAPVPEWQKQDDPRRKITIDQLLRMSSGLVFKEVYAPFADVVDMLFGSYDFAAFAAAKPLEVEPDTKWYYSSGTANIVARIVRQIIEKEYEYYYQFLYEKLFDKIGMYSAVVEPDASGTFVGSSYAHATPRDWARFGLLYLQDGIWEGERILPEGWVTYTTTPTPNAPKGEYGAYFWLNAGNPDNPAERRWPGSPGMSMRLRGFRSRKSLSYHRRTWCWCASGPRQTGRPGIRMNSSKMFWRRFQNSWSKTGLQGVE